MYQKFLDFVEENVLFRSDERILLAVSGGVDSMVMAHLCLKAGYRFAVAHCNFQLRGQESDRDQQFVESFAKEHGLTFHVNKFDTEAFASENSLSLQMAARRLRYQWFEKLKIQYSYDIVGMGHNKNDLVETFFINIARGTGLKGITGIKPRNDYIIRPVLFAAREDILHFSREYNIGYREDSSNRTVKYHRNKIRHHIVPRFQEINPRFPDTMWENMERFQDAYNIYIRAINEKISELTFQKEDDLYVDINKLQQLPEASTYLFEILKPYHFSKEVVHKIIEHLDAEPGKEFFSPSHKLVRDRHYLIISVIETENANRYYIDEGVRQISAPIFLKFRFIEDVRNYGIPLKDPRIVSIDYDKLQFPLIIRKWQQGDYFKPFGFNHFKKLSDFFVDRKYSLLDKERVWILASGEKIIWIIGDRLDDRFKIEPDTRRILEITWADDYSV
ncbi:MAG: tRNA lysidine(34) synthetase TilS [Bacteroidota bacterium]